MAQKKTASGNDGGAAKKQIARQTDKRWDKFQDSAREQRFEQLGSDESGLRSESMCEEGGQFQDSVCEPNFIHSKQEDGQGFADGKQENGQGYIESLREEERRQMFEKILQLLDDETFIDAFIVGNPKIEGAVITAYLKNRQRGVPVMGTGGAALAPVNRPKTLMQAKQLCEQLLKGL